MSIFKYDAADEGATERLGQALAAALPAGSVVALNGTLGAGKTRLVQAVAAALGVPRRSVTSPTFVLVGQYDGERPVYHFDAYRLRDEDEFLELGPEEYFDGEGISLVEWADRVAGGMPPHTLAIRIDVTGETSRRFQLTSDAPVYDAVLSAVRAALDEKPDIPG